MDRRSFLRGLATLSGVTALAGCGGDPGVPETAPSPPPAVRRAGRQDEESDVGGSGDDTAGDTVSANGIVLAGQNILETSDGDLVITATVRNDGTNRGTVLVAMSVDAAGETVIVKRFVELTPGESTTIRFTPDVRYDDYGGHVPDIRPETPATPLPSDTPSL